MKNARENYSAEIIPQILINCKEFGCVGGDWNNITENIDATKNQAQKQSKSLKRLLKNFNWVDSFRHLHPHSKQYSRYYDNVVHGEGPTRIDRSYHFGDIEILEAYYVGVAFSDHLSYIVKIKVPNAFKKLSSPKSKPLFKSKPDVIQDPIFKQKLKENFLLWSQVKNNGLDCLSWWELVVKPGVKKLLIDRSRELNLERTGTGLASPRGCLSSSWSRGRSCPGTTRSLRRSSCSPGLRSSMSLRMCAYTTMNCTENISNDRKS